MTKERELKAGMEEVEEEEKEEKEKETIMTKRRETNWLTSSKMAATKTAS